MSEKTQPVDLTKMRLARQGLTALQEELAGIEETEHEMEEVMKHVEALEYILSTAKNQKVSFSSLQFSDLQNMGIAQKTLRIIPSELDSMLSNSTINSEHLDNLCTQITRIHRHVSMKYEPGARMILDAILLAVAQVCVDGKAKLSAAILPELRIATGDGVLIKNPATDFQLWLTGNADYGMCVYEDESNKKRLLGGSLAGVVRFAKSYITLVEAKRSGDAEFWDYIPEAAGQAVALSEVTGLSTVRYCMSDGKNWLFALFTKDANGNRVCYESHNISITPETRETALFRKDVHQVVELLYHWLVSEVDPLSDPLYSLCDT
ncbi:hypothetical protein PAXINDRAFT_168983 [Paxillus involutus ATCC 200175]|uniref:Uncharacterized protein n=1 Tax=Paxillus involutus ATCC 200175 TaxID=664439 RepID=A0A0C9SZC4_PAXIN|nr:hypothetical protein PAXINDRAFT_168983 [Paxillus involutus ATCC 200175]